MQECIRASQSPSQAEAGHLLLRQAVRLGDLAAACALILLLLPMLGFVAAVGDRDGAGTIVRRFRGDQLFHLFGVFRGELSFFRAARRPLAFAD